MQKMITINKNIQSKILMITIQQIIPEDSLVQTVKERRKWLKKNEERIKQGKLFTLSSIFK